MWDVILTEPKISRNRNDIYDEIERRDRSRVLESFKNMILIFSLDSVIFSKWNLSTYGWLIEPNWHLWWNWLENISRITKIDTYCWTMRLYLVCHIYIILWEERRWKVFYFVTFLTQKWLFSYRLYYIYRLRWLLSYVYKVRFWFDCQKKKLISQQPIILFYEMIFEMISFKRFKESNWLW